MRLVLFVLVFIGVTACNKSAENTSGDSQQAKTAGISGVQEVATMLDDAKVELDKKNFRRTIEITIKVNSSDPKNAKAYYFQSQAQSLTGDQEKAIKALENAFINGLEPSEEVLKNKNFASIRESNEFKSLTRKYSAKQTGSVVISDKETSAGDASIRLEGGQQVIRAGDVEITTQNN